LLRRGRFTPRSVKTAQTTLPPAAEVLAQASLE
jgi:hypothetical protein